ncbi:MAG: ABC transporter permease, partial [Proteobacteria bacterium]|nr:ABC transporter permease [Pseudomonadota bacterium]
MTQSSKKENGGILKRIFSDLTLRRGVASILIFLTLWEIGFRFHEWFGVMVPFVGKIDAPTLVVARWREVVLQPGYWESWYLSFGRVFFGFLVAQVIGIPFGLAMAVNKNFRGLFFPPFEILRPIPP